MRVCRAQWYLRRTADGAPRALTVCSFSFTSNRFASHTTRHGPMLLSHLCAPGFVASCRAFEPGFPELTGLVDHENEIVSFPDSARGGRDFCRRRYGGPGRWDHIGAGA